MGPYQVLPLWVKADSASNGNEGVIHTPKSSWTRALPWDAIYYYIQATHL